MKSTSPHVVIAGCGISGIASGIALKRQLGFSNFTIYEKSNGVGGTWRTSTYPGCASDIPCHWYSLSSDLNPNWPSHFATQPEILAYWESIWRRHNLSRHTKFETSVYESVWDEAAQVYNVTLRDESTGKMSVVSANFVIYGLGGFMAPQYPKTVPLEQVKIFTKGAVWHSAEWRHDVELKNKRVAVIENGCSGAQIVPALASDPSIKVLNFIRSPQWLVPMNQFQYRPSIKWIFRHVPFIMRWYRNAIMARADLEFLVFRKKNRRLRELAIEGLTSYIKSVAPEALWEKLIPDYPVGAKQIIVDPKYLKSLSRPNVELRTEPIECLVENGIKLKNEQVVEVDAIVFATGYSLPRSQEPTNLRIRGLNGKTIQEYFSEQGGPTAYLGGNFPGFPNLCYIIGTLFLCPSYTLRSFNYFAGANAATGHASLLFDMEAQIHLAMQLIEPVITRKITSLTIKQKVTDEYNAWLQRRIATSVWPSCTESYYYVDGTSSTKNIAMFPGPAMLFWWLARKPHWSEWEFFGANGRPLRDRPFRLGLVDRDLILGSKVFGAVIVLLVSWVLMRK
ncbi:hypothetical protein GYMLUDRAFT_79861 [Collybiopsis luxurians FD-317 M1]|nr:hypothetical protein GYMLUDRAFT_79861 [Collybiopsis luxurians FD-317 M1]